MTIKKASILKIINPIVGLLFLSQAGLGIFHEIIPYEIFHAIHGPLGYIFTLLVVSHIYLNWNWIKTNFFKKNR